MDVIKAYSRRSLFWLLLFTSILCILINMGFVFALKTASEKILFMAAAQTNQVKAFIHQTAVAADMFGLYFIPVSTGFFCLSGLFVWLFLRFSFVRVMRKSEILSKKKLRDSTPKPVADTKEKVRNDRRLFLHLLSVLQREGRLLDFFSEDLEEYEDEQIGAAVRSIHENCKKTVDKYLTSEPVVREDEDDEINIKPGFDPGAIKLTGNVTGEPPFKGVVRHRGWRAKKLELPTLSKSQDPNIIAPAEVEIL